MPVSIALAVTALAAVTWIYLALGHGMFWRTAIRLPPRRSAALPRQQWPSVAIVVPARDEADILPATLPTLLAQQYPGPARVIVVDDGSTDGTAELAGDLAARQGATLPLTVTSPGDPPPGWTGKLWAMRRGVHEAGGAQLLLFTDADIAHRPDSLARLVASLGERALVSQMARLRVASRWERLIIPAFVYFFAQLYPFSRVNRPGGRTAAAAGGCVLIRATALDAIGGLESISGAVIDDVALARAVKRSGATIWLGLAETVDSARPYPRLADLWNMVARSAFTQLRHSAALLAGTVIGLALVYLVPPVATVAGFATGAWRIGLEGTIGWALMTVTYLPMLVYYRVRPPWALLLPVSAVLYLGMTVHSALRHWTGGGARWKGRSYGRPAGVPPLEPLPPEDPTQPRARMDR